MVKLNNTQEIIGTDVLDHLGLNYVNDKQTWHR